MWVDQPKRPLKATSGTESAYCVAWTILEERYGNPFLIAKAFRDKLDTGPR